MYEVDPLTLPLGALLDPGLLPSRSHLLSLLVLFWRRDLLLRRICAALLVLLLFLVFLATHF